MFADSLLETSWTQRTRRGWTTLTSFGLETALIGLLLLLPLWQTVGLPSVRALSTPVSLGGPPPAARPVVRQRSTTIVQSNLADNIMIAPREIPRHVADIVETIAPPQLSFSSGLGVEGGTGAPNADGVWKSLNESLIHSVPLPVAAAPNIVRPFRTSSILEGSLIRRVMPTYPPLAKNARIQGPVVLFAIISKAGTIDKLHAISGHPMLVPAALEAVSQWRYRPFILNGEPVEVETQITVNFTLAAN